VARERGQATVELLGVVPVVLAFGLVLWQLILVGHTAWMSAHAARAAARAGLVGEDPERAARSVAEEAEVRTGKQSGATRVELAIPFVYRGWRAPVAVAARTSLEAVP
jgi:pilus assembly protein CpaE